MAVLPGLDIDVLDPAHASGTGTPAADGLPRILTLIGVPSPNG
ncbi:arginase family protein [Streptomyces sp. PTD5-9]